MSCCGSGVAVDFLFTRANVLGLYRDILKAARLMPTANKVEYIKYKAKKEFRKYQHTTDTETRLLQIRLAMTQLDAIKLQTQHLQGGKAIDTQEESNAYWAGEKLERDIFG